MGHKTSANTMKDMIVIIIFLGCLFVPLFAGFFQPKQTTSNVENRELAKLPALPKNIKEINEIPNKIDKYYSDHFGFRQQLTHFYKKLKIYIKDSPSEDVTIGKNGWLFLGSNKNGYSKFGDPMGDYRNQNLYSKEELKQIVQYFNGQYRWLKRQGIEYVFFIAPNKHTIYPENLPTFIKKTQPYSATDQLIEALRRYTQVPVIDLRQPLKNAKNKQLYYKGDTHWNHEAANIAQYHVMSFIETLFKGMIKAEMFEIYDSKTPFNGDLARFIGAKNYDKFNPQPNLSDFCKVKNVQHNDKGTNFTSTCSTAKLKALVYGDSFFRNFIMDYFSVKFHQTTFLWRKPHYQSLKNEIKKHKPDIVVEEWVERHLPYVPRNHDIFDKVR